MGFFSSILGGGGSADEAAAYERAMQRRRERKIGWSLDAIDKNFAGFDDNYYAGIERDALDFYRPQVEEQSDAARRNLIFALARRRGIDSTSGQGMLSGLQRQTMGAFDSVADKARGIAMNQRGTVESNRAELENQARIAADPSAAATSSLARMRYLSAPPALTPLGDLFAAYSGTLGNAAALETMGYPGTGTGLFAPKPSSTTRVVT